MNRKRVSDSGDKDAGVCESAKNHITVKKGLNSWVKSGVLSLEDEKSLKDLIIFNASVILDLAVETSLLIAYCIEKQL